MTKTLKAVYENGVFRPAEPPGLSEGSQVELTVRIEEHVRQNGAGIRALARLAALPLQGKSGPFSGADHDEELYGNNGAR